VRSLERNKTLFSEKIIPEKLESSLVTPSPDRLAYIHYALATGYGLEEIHRKTKIDPWFLNQLQEIVELENRLKQYTIDTLTPELLRECKRAGFSDQNVSEFLAPEGGINATASQVMEYRYKIGLRPVFKRVDTCAAEFESFTPYLYSTYESECEAAPSKNKKIMILGSGPNRIGQGIEFDYCCCHASFALKDAGYETIMVNCNPETVSTDYDTSDRLYFEPLTFEDVREIVAVEKPDGVIVQFGGQTPLNLAVRLQEAGVPIIGTSPDNIDLAEDRKRFGKLLDVLAIPQPKNGTAMCLEDARAVAAQIGYPVLVRPSYVLGGRAMSIVYDQPSLDSYMTTAVEASPEHPVLIDKFLENASEYDVDAICDGDRVIIAGVMEHIEEAGIHSGDSTCVLPPIMIDPQLLVRMKQYTEQLGNALHVIGLMNIQFAVQKDTVYVLEVNPRASRTIPYVSKSTGVPLAKMAARVMAGEKLKELGITEELQVRHCFVKSPVFPFNKFPGVDSILGPEMRSTGEVMGVAESFGSAFAKAQLSAGVCLPRSGRVFLSVNDQDKPKLVSIARDLKSLGFQLMATSGTQSQLGKEEIEASTVFKVGEGRPNIVDLIKSKKIDLIINTPQGQRSHYDDKVIRHAATQHGVPCITTLSGAAAATLAIRTLQTEKLTVRSLQEYHSDNK
jgi:carbamoyl-phosphate synthase large subunit